ncbi:MAG: PA2169 family four-helix-bundle protein [Porphyrobacter sp.]|nr:PA2169 family four-helix-bundle protein [Porphyrobacter sp.]
MARDDHEISLLNALIRATADSIDGYRGSADKAADNALKAQLADRALERTRIVALLRDQVRFLGGEPEREGSLPGRAQRVFDSLRAAVAGRNDAALLEEIRRGEAHLINRYEEALADEELSLDTLEVIEEGERCISAGYGKLLALFAPQV